MMDYLLMNKDIPVCELMYDADSGSFIDMTVLNEEYAPFSVQYGSYIENSQRKNLNEWFRERRIPKGRDGYIPVTASINHLLGDDWFALSLSDQFWVRHKDSELKWEDVSFFTNPYKKELSFGGSNRINHPNRTTSGMVKKTWVNRRKKNYLLKGGYLQSVAEPFIEVLASMLCETIGLPHAEYSIEKYQGNVVCRCPCLINDNEEMIDAYSVFLFQKQRKGVNDISSYKLNLKKLGIEDTSQVDAMFAVDYLIKNADRHMCNFGVIREIEDRSHFRITPVYDSGEGFGTLNQHNECKFFRNTKCDFEYMLSRLDKQELQKYRFDQKLLMETADKWKVLLIQWQPESGMSDACIRSFVQELSDQIRKLCLYLQES